MPFEEGYNLVLSTVRKGEAGRAELHEALDRVLAEDLCSDRDSPPFNKSAMDGYACRREDLANELLVKGEIPAGSVPGVTIDVNQCARIMTGAMVPEGADCVLMLEHAVSTGLNRIRATRITDQANICYRAEDLRKGDLIIPAGTWLRPSHIAVLASAGVIKPLLFRQPSIGVLSTGNELVEPDRTPMPHQIRNSNGPQLLAQLKGMGVHAGNEGISGDSLEEVRDHLSQMLGKYDVILVSGGVSVGDYDFVPAVLETLGAEILLHGLNVKPGKHLLFARLNNRFVFGLPGNPVSSFVQFELLIKPFLKKWMGWNGPDPFYAVPLGTDFVRRKAENMLFIPVRACMDGSVVPVEYHGSAHIQAFTGADAILEIPVGTAEIKKGDIVHVRPL